MHRNIPLVVIVGSTACGKSKLAIELARRFGGEILSADSMQVYRGLDIVTNKVTKKEQALAKHHLIDIIDPTQRYSVVDFTKKSLKIIHDLHEQSRLPIVVGGTNYYIEPLLWKNFLVANVLDEPEANSKGLDSQSSIEPSVTLMDREIISEEERHTEDDLQDEQKFFAKTIKLDSLKNIPSDKLWTFLEKVDPEAAHHYHYNQHRGITRALQIYQQTGKRFSELANDINKSVDGTFSLGGDLRFEKTCVLYLSCDTKTINKLIDDRVDQMVNMGLLTELEYFHERYNKDRVSTSDKAGYTRGIFQAIGFKEFHEYLTLDSEEKTSDKGKEILEKCITELKLTTRRYARKQTKWVRSRFLKKNRRNNPDLFELPVYQDEARWFQEVCEPAIRIVDSYMNDKPLTEDLENRKPTCLKEYLFNKPEKFHCEACDRTFIGSTNIGCHLSSRRHQRRVQSLKSSTQVLNNIDDDIVDERSDAKVTDERVIKEAQ